MGTDSLVVYVNGEYLPKDLMGITRQTVFELAAEHKIPAREAELTAYDLYAADEVFLTSTAGGIMPLAEIDGRPVGDGKPGPVSQRVHGLYWSLRETGRDGTPCSRPDPQLTIANVRSMLAARPVRHGR